MHNQNLNLSFTESKIQNFGQLICIDSQGLIQGISANIKDLFSHDFSHYLGLPYQGLLEQHLPLWTGEIAQYIDEIAHQKLLRKLLQVEINAKQVYLSIYQDGPYIFFEFETQIKSSVTLLQMNDFSNLLDSSPQAIWKNLSHSMRSILEFDRVMIMKIDDIGAGVIVSESTAADVKHFQGHRFSENFMSPEIVTFFEESASRFCLNTAAHTTDFYNNNEHHIPQHLSQFAPIPKIHLAFLKSIHVASAIFVPIQINNEFWGMLIGHHSSKKWLDLQQRQLAALLVQYTANTYEKSLNSKLLSFHKNVGLLEQELTLQLQQAAQMECVFNRFMDPLCKMANADGFVVYKQDDIHTFGTCPSNEQLINIVELLNKRAVKNLGKYNNFKNKYARFYTDSLPFPGLMFLRIAKKDDYYLLWFRKENIAQITQTGLMPAQNKNGSAFEKVPLAHLIWENTLLDTAEPWDENDLYFTKRIQLLVQNFLLYKSEEQLQTNKELMALNNELEMLTFTLSHDIKNPLSIVKLGAQMLMTKIAPNHQPTKDWALAMEDAAKSMESLIGSLLSFSQARSYTFKKVPVATLPILKKVIMESKLHHQLDTCQIIWGQTLPILAEANLIYQVFLNIIGNAIKYASRQDQPCLTISSEMQDPFIVYHIKDNGIGIPEDEIHHIFEIFKRSSNATSYAGTGLGLALVKRIMERLEGRIEISSPNQEGTSIRLYFPKEQIGNDRLQ